jgi:spore maturation protein CgeB
LTQPKFKCVFLGLSITSTWGNGHATTYRGLLKALSRRGHSCTFLERDVPWYAANREFDELPYCKVKLYGSLKELKEGFANLIRSADIVVVGSYVPDGIAIGRWVTSIAKNATAFYDIDTPVTLANIWRSKCEYISPDLYPKYNLYLSFTGGPTLDYIEQKLNSPCARALYCSVDPSLYYPERQPAKWDIAYLGTYAPDRQPALEKLLLSVARQNRDRKFAVAGPQYPEAIAWPDNVDRIDHLPATEHRSFYNSQIHSESDSQRYGSRRVFSQRAPVRSRCLRSSYTDRPVARASNSLHTLDRNTPCTLGSGCYVLPSDAPRAPSTNRPKRAAAHSALPHCCCASSGVRSSCSRIA